MIARRESLSRIPADADFARKRSSGSFPRKVEHQMVFEVEQKFPVAERAALLTALEELGAEKGPPIEQVDAYFAHPQRDFATTDEALRIRRVGEENYVTYKGPKLDAETKTRREIELPLAAGREAARQAGELLEALGFRHVAGVRKVRLPLTIPWKGRLVTAAIDEVDQLGTFVELELLADEHELDSARRALASLAAELPLQASERRSYLELLLEG